jgi:hypothetical protein
VTFISSLFIDVSVYHNSRRKIRKELVFTITSQAIITVALNSFKIFSFHLTFREKKRGKRGGVGRQMKIHRIHKKKTQRTLNRNSRNE